MSFCDLCQWDVQDDCFHVGADRWCRACIEASLPDEMENIFSILSHFIPEGFNKQALEIAA